MTYISTSGLLGQIDLSVVEQDGPNKGRQNFYNEIVHGYDDNLGGGEFVYAKFAGTIAAGAWVTLVPSLSGGVVVSTATAWDGTANTGFPLGVAVAAGAAGQWGWFQVGGNAVAKTSGTTAAGDKVFWQAAGVTSSTGVNGKQVMGAQCATAANASVGGSAIGAGLSVVQIARPHVQGQIV